MQELDPRMTLPNTVNSTEQTKAILAPLEPQPHSQSWAEEANTQQSKAGIFYQKPHDLYQIPEYAGEYCDDVAYKWLYKVDQYFYKEQELYNLFTTDTQMIVICKGHLIKEASD